MSDFPAWEAFPVWEGETYPGHPDPRARTVNNLMFMGLAMHNFAAANGGRFPASAIRKGGQALLSWRVAILPFLEQFALYERFHLDEAWDSPHNVSLLKEMPGAYAPVTLRESTPYATCYQRVVGRGSLLSGDEGTRADVNFFARPTLMIVEAAEPVPWTKPRGLALRRCEAVATTRRAVRKRVLCSLRRWLRTVPQAASTLPKLSAPSSRTGNRRVATTDKPGSRRFPARRRVVPQLLAGHVCRTEAEWPARSRGDDGETSEAPFSGVYGKQITNRRDQNSTLYFSVIFFRISAVFC